MQNCCYCKLPLKGRLIETKEMMFGTRQAFQYCVCEECGSCCLTTPLGSFALSTHYPSNYYSLKLNIERKGAFKLALLRSRGRFELGSFDPLGAVLHTIKAGDPTFLMKFGVTAHSRILDVGCGGGLWLHRAAEYGLSNLRGCDPFIEQDLQWPHVTITKQSIEDVSGLFDYIFFHHSFEHLVEPKPSLMAARERLGPGGRCIIRCPTTSSEAFDRYGPNWVQLDPPRHISIPSRDGMKSLAASCGFSLNAMLDDSSAFQFWGSEQYCNDIPLTSESSWSTSPERSRFTQHDIDQFDEDAKALNVRHRGDQTAFVLHAI